MPPGDKDSASRRITSGSAATPSVPGATEGLLQGVIAPRPSGLTWRSGRQTSAEQPR